MDWRKLASIASDHFNVLSVAVSRFGRSQKSDIKRNGDRRKTFGPVEKVALKVVSSDFVRSEFSDARTSRISARTL